MRNVRPPSRRVFLTAAACWTSLAYARPSLAAPAPYGLDTVSREIPKRGPVRCPKVELVKYAGKHVRYRGGTKVYVGFRERLERFEQVVVKVATKHYGRAPKRIVHLGTYNCRRISAYPNLLSEHALGNAIDIEGFDFGRLPRDATLPKGAPKGLRLPQRVRILRHWKGKRGIAARHRAFLHDLAKALIARRDIFRVLLGPGFPGHHNHFHFDCAPYRMVEVF